MSDIMTFCVLPETIRLCVEHSRQHDNFECPVALTLQNMYSQARWVKVYSKRVEIGFDTCAETYVDANGSLEAFTRVFDNEETDLLESWLSDGCPIDLRKQLC